MKIDLNSDFTLKDVAALLRSATDKEHTQLRVSDKGIAYISNDVGVRNLSGVKFRLGTWAAGNDYVGENAAQDNEWIEKIYRVLKNNWPNPSLDYIDHF